MAFPEKWEQFFRFSLQALDGTVIEFTAETQDLSGIELTKKDFEGVQMANGGFTRKHANLTDETVKLKVYPLNGAASLEQLYQAGSDSTNPIVIPVSHTRNLHQAILVWCTGLPASPATAGAVTVSLDAALRLVGKAVEIVDVAYDPSDKELSAEVTLKWTPMDKDGNSNRNWDSTDGTADETLPAVASYTSS